MLRSLPLLLALVPSVALAVPMSLTHAGRIADDTGAPLVGEHSLAVTLYDGSGGSVWSDTFTTDFDDGAFAIVLGSGAPLASEHFAGDQLLVGLAVDGGDELPVRVPITSVPFAIRAGEARSVSGGTVDVTEVRVNGAVVIDSSGTFVGAGGADADTLAELSCGADQVAAFDGVGWACADRLGAHEHDAAEITSGTLSIDRLPIGASAGTVAAGDHVHGFGEITGQLASSQLPTDFGDQVRGAVTGAPIDLPAGSTLGGAPIPTGSAYTDDMARAAMGAKASTNALHHDRYTNNEAVAAMGAKASTNALNHDRYTNNEAVTAMGAKASTNALNHDRYTDSEAVAAMGAKNNANALNHDRFTDANAVSAIQSASALNLPAATQVAGANLQQQLRMAAARSVCYGGVGAGMPGRTEFSIIMIPYRSGTTNLDAFCQGNINGGWNACGVAKSNYFHQNCNDITNTSYGGGYTSFARRSYAQARIADGSYSACNDTNMYVCCSPECSGW
jgi:hypothetical protein